MPADADLTAATVNYQAQATVPMTLMRLVGIDNITITVTAQTKKTTGLEIAVVLDNTGSMLCAANDGTRLRVRTGCRAVGHDMYEFLQQQPHLHPDQRRHRNSSTR